MMFPEAVVLCWGCSGVKGSCGGGFLRAGCGVRCGDRAGHGAFLAGAVGCPGGSRDRRRGSAGGRDHERAAGAGTGHSIWSWLSSGRRLGRQDQHPRDGRPQASSYAGRGRRHRFWARRGRRGRRRDRARVDRGDEGGRPGTAVIRRPDVSSSDGSIAVGGNLGSASTTHIGTQVLGVSSMPVAAAVKDPQAVYTAVGLDRFTGQVWLAGEVDRFVAANPCGYVFIEAEAGLGKTAFAAWLVSTRGYLSHFSRLGYSLNRSKLPGMDQPRAVSEAEELLITRAGRRLHMSAVMLVRSITAVHRRSACASYKAACCAKVSITVRCHSGLSPGQKALHHKRDGAQICT